MSLFWGHSGLPLALPFPPHVSALSGESILGPRGASHLAFDVEIVSALSGESILGPHTLRLAFSSGAAYVFQHSLVSLFWGHGNGFMLNT